MDSDAIRRQMVAKLEKSVFQPCLGGGQEHAAHQSTNPIISIHRQLVANLEKSVTSRAWAADEDGLRGVLAEAHAAASAPGSATVILAAAGSGGIVHVANLGDCGVRVVRDGECSFASTVRLCSLNAVQSIQRKVSGLHGAAGLRLQHTHNAAHGMCLTLLHFASACCCTCPARLQHIRMLCALFCCFMSPPNSAQDMLHDYNTPFQLGRVEEDDEDEEVDTPDDAELYEIEVRPQPV